MAMARVAIAFWPAQAGWPGGPLCPALQQVKEDWWWRRWWSTGAVTGLHACIASSLARHRTMPYCLWWARDPFLRLAVPSGAWLQPTRAPSRRAPPPACEAVPVLGWGQVLQGGGGGASPRVQVGATAAARTCVGVRVS
jgi:hypothetical protein